MRSTLSKHLKFMLFLLLMGSALLSCKKNQSADEIKPEAPQITNIQPKNPQPGDLVTITGTRFGATATDVKVTIGNTMVTIASVTTTEIKFTIPATLSSGDLAVLINGISAVNKDPLGTTITVTPKTAATPTFTAMAPSSGKTGDVITLTGTGFSAQASENKVFFATTTGGTVVLATVKTASTTQLTVEVPANVITGGILITVSGTNVVPVAGFSSTFTVTSTASGTAVDYINTLSGSLKFSKIATAGRDIGAMWMDKVKNVLYYTDYVYPGVTGNTVYKIDATSGASTALTTDARITNVRNIATDVSGNVYVLRYAETSLVFTIYKISADGATVTEIIKSFEPVGVFCFFVNANNELCLRPDLKISAAGAKITTGPKLDGLAFDRGAHYSGSTAYLVQCPDNNNAAGNAKFLKWNMDANTVADADFTLKSLFNTDDASSFSGSNKISQLRVTVDAGENLYAIMDHSYISGSTSKTWMIRKTKNGSGTSSLLGTFLIKFPAIDINDYSAAVEFMADATGNLYFKANSKDIIRITQ